jgi:hypothetical protein
LRQRLDGYWVKHMGIQKLPRATNRGPIDQRTLRLCVPGGLLQGKNQFTYQIMLRQII